MPARRRGECIRQLGALRFARDEGGTEKALTAAGAVERCDHLRVARGGGGDAARRVPRGDLRARAEPELVEDALHVTFGRALADDEPVGDVPVGEAERDQPRDLDLALGERLHRSRALRDRDRVRLELQPAVTRPARELRQIPRRFGLSPISHDMGELTLRAGGIVSSHQIDASKAERRPDDRIAGVLEQGRDPLECVGAAPRIAARERALAIQIRHEVALDPVLRLAPRAQLHGIAGDRRGVVGEMCREHCDEQYESIRDLEIRQGQDFAELATQYEDRRAPELNDLLSARREA